MWYNASHALFPNRAVFMVQNHWCWCLEFSIVWYQHDGGQQLLQSHQYRSPELWQIEVLCSLCNPRVNPCVSQYACCTPHKKAAMATVTVTTLFALFVQGSATNGCRYPDSQSLYLYQHILNMIDSTNNACRIGYTATSWPFNPLTVHHNFLRIRECPPPQKSWQYSNSCDMEKH